MHPYTAADTLRIAKRYNNPKRSYLLVNPLQAKHIPVSPAAALEMMGALGDQVAAKYPEARLVIGFAETATAIGAAVAARLGPDCLYVHTPGRRWTEIGSSFGRSTATQRSTGSVPTSWRTGSTAAPPSYSWMTSSPPGGPSSTWSSSCGSGIPGWASGGWQLRPSSAGSLRRTRPGWQRPALPVSAWCGWNIKTMSGW